MALFTLDRLGRHEPGNPHSLECSCGVLTTKGYRIVVDSGFALQSHAEHDKTEVGPDFSLFEDGKAIDAVLITHVHLDHCGALAKLSRYLAPHAKIFMTRTSAAMIRMVLEESLMLAEKRGTAAQFTAEEMEDVLGRVVEVHRPGAIEILPGVRCYVHPAGHMPGACSFTIRIGRINVHYAGDRCSHDQPGTLGATPLPAEWRENLVIASMDGTYGADPDSDSRDRESELARASEAGARTMQAGAPVFVHTFATRGVATAADLERHGLSQHGPVYLDGSTRHFGDKIMNPGNWWSDRDSAPHLGHIGRIKPMRNKRHPTRKPKDQNHRDAIVREGGGYAIIATPGMGGPGGVATYWRRHVLENPKALVLFTGYVAPDTDGALILAAARERQARGLKSIPIRLVEEMIDHQTGERYPEEVQFILRCEVMQVRLGAHDSRAKTLAWILDEMRPMALVLNHGSTDALESLERDASGHVAGVYPAHRVPHVELDL